MRFGMPLPFVALAVLAIVGCAPTSAPRAMEESSSGTSPRARTLVTAIRVEPTTLASTLGLGGGATLSFTQRLFNAYFTNFDQRGDPQPHLAAELPRLNTPSWVVSPDGRMETVYKLRPGLTWHDQAPLTADDFVFASQVYASPARGSANAPPFSLMHEVIATDPSTVTFRWKGLHAGAGTLAREFPPLPRHVLEPAFLTVTPEIFAANPYWSTQFLAAGPFRLDRWAPGAFIEGSAFTQHVLGAPKIARVRLIFNPDPNTALANMLAGEVHLSADDSLRFKEGMTLRREWGSEGGSVILRADLWRAVFVQFRPELLAASGLGDVRVRKALALTLDKEGINQVLFEGEGIMADVAYIPKTMGYYPTIEPAATKYPFDPSRAQVLLTDAGYTRGADGVWVSPTAGRLAFPVLTGASGQNEIELSILGAGWRVAGFDVQETIMPAAQLQDGQARSVFPGLSAISLPNGEDALATSSTAGISAAENRWTGRNRGGWSNAEFDRFATAFSTTLDQQQRVQAITQMVRIYSEELPGISMFFNAVPLAHVAALKGPQAVAPNVDWAWNVWEWELR